jgi:predicted pyridoxine 5'-phosphate oxidase superfamily flavin-nucleotide-binding protein
MNATGTARAVFHAGELAVQERAGVREKIAAVGERMIRDTMPAQHRELFEKLPTLLVGSLDGQRRPWASVLAGQPGFIQASDEQHLHIAAAPLSGDPLSAQLEVGVPLGLLGIEPATRRRNRMNGTVVARDAGSFTVQVDQSFGNCPKYIQARTPRWHDPNDGPGSVQNLGASLHAAARALVRQADTLFIASASTQARGAAGAEGVDVSHRGGKPGFVRLELDTTGSRTVLTLPDFHGNLLFNTLGNIAAHPFAGLLFIDHDTGDLLQLSGAARLLFDGAALRSFDGAQRLLQVQVDQAWWRPGALPLRWSAPEFAPQLAATGQWGDAGT